MTDSAQSVRFDVAKWLLVATIIGSALALGSQHTVVLCVAVVGLGAAAFLAWYSADAFRARPAATLLLFTGIGLTVWTLVQALPMPRSMLGTVAPANADVWSRALSPFKEAGPAWAPISLDPTSTRVQVLRGVAYLLAFLTALRIAHKKEGSVFLERALVASVVVMALAALLHPTFGATKVFGVYQPVHGYAYVPKHVGPLLNANHLSGYMTLGVCVALGVVLSPRPGSSRAICGAVVLLAIATQLWAGSRGGTLAMLLGLALVPCMTWLSSRGERRRLVRAFVPAALAAAGVAMSVLASFDHALQDLASADVSKASVWAQATRLLRSHPWWGTGRGAFESVFPAVRTGSGYYVFTHPENMALQWGIEWGIPCAIVAAACIVAGLRPNSVLARSRPAIEAWAALACLFVHNLVDFSSEVPGVMIALVVCAAMVVGGTGAAVSTRRQAWSQRPSALAVVAAAVAVLAIIVAYPTAGEDLNSDQAALHEQALDGRISRDAFRSSARASMLRHPADPYLPFVGAVHAARAGEESVMPWVGRALERSPVYGRAHLLLARSLAPRAAPQARLEYRLALTDEAFLSGYVMAEAPRLVQSFEDALEITPKGAAGVDVLEGLAVAVSARLPATRVRLDAEILARDPSAMGPRRRAVEDALLEIRDEEAAPWCGTGSTVCIDRGLTAVTRLIEAQPRGCSGYFLRAQLMVAKGEARQAIDQLGAAVDQVDDRGACARRVLTLSMELHDEVRTNEAIDRLARAGCPEDMSCADNYVYLAHVEESRGNLRRALALYKKGCEVAPERDDIQAERARVASALGLHVEAFQVYMLLAQQKPGEPRWGALAAAEKAALSRAVPEVK